MTKSTTDTARQDIDIQYDDNVDPPQPAAVRAALAAVLPHNATVTVRFISAAESRATNLRYLGKNRPTNVLAFPVANSTSADGDIAICPQIVEREAHDIGATTAEHYAHMLVHAALHLRGMRHDNPADAVAMARAETRTLASLGFINPYADEKR